MGIFDSFVASDPVEKKGIAFFKSAVPIGTEMCRINGVIGQIPSAVAIEPEKAEMIVVVALLHCTMCRFLLGYLSENPQASQASYRKFCYAVCNAGKDYYGADFATVMQAGQEFLYSRDAQNRIMIDARDSLSLQMSVTVECVDWCFRMLNHGKQTDMLVKDQVAFLRVVHRFDVFATCQMRAISF